MQNSERQKILSYKPILRRSAESHGFTSPQAFIRGHELALSLESAEDATVLNIRRFFADNLKRIRELEEWFHKLSQDRDVTIPASAEWLLDNSHIIDQHAADIKTMLTPAFYRRLPAISNPKGIPRVLEIALNFVLTTDNIFEPEQLTAYLDGFQSKQPLTLRELWALPLILRVAIFEKLRRLFDDVAEKALLNQSARALLVEVSAGEGNISPSAFTIAFASNLRQHAYRENGCFLSSLLEELRLIGEKTATSQLWLKEYAKEQQIDLSGQTRQATVDEAATRVAVGNSILSFRAISLTEWRRWVEENSLVHKLLVASDSTYSASDFQTRNFYRTRIEKLAAENRISELCYTEKVLCERGDTSLYRFLVQNGYTIWQRFFSKYALAIYLTSALGLFISLVAIGIAIAPSLLELHIVAIFALAFIAIEVVLLLANLILPATLKGTPLPRLDFSKGIPSEWKTLVVVHGLLLSKEAIDEDISGLEVRYLGNRDANLIFGYAADPKDRVEAKTAQESDELSRYALAKINELNHKYNGAQFLLLTRAPAWNESEKVFMAYERKRGKLEELNKLILGEAGTTFVNQESLFSILKGTRLVITLDSDTALPPKSAAKLVGVAAHPCMKPVVNEGRVIDGYSLFQPLVTHSLVAAAKTRFGIVFSGAVGSDPYTGYVSDLYQELFREGNYIGKGIYNVEAFHHALTDKIQPNSILSHDLFEGFFARVGYIGDVELEDSYPTTYLAYRKREHRWIRGDWQLLPYLCRAPLRSIERLKILDNFRRSLTGPIAVLAIVLFPDVTLAVAVLLVIGALINVTTNVFALLKRKLVTEAYFNFAAILREISRTLWHQLLQLVFLADRAVFCLDAIVRTLHRLFVSREKLLQWESSAEVGGRFANSGWQKHYLSMRWAVLVAAIVVIHPSVNIYSGVLGVSWFLAPALAAFLSKQDRSITDRTLGVKEKQYLLTLAKDTYQFFEDHLTDADKYLMPDNLQLLPDEKIAHRTSPTNIGLSILAVISGKELGLISASTALQKLEGIIKSLEELERFKGHFLNWYETTSGRALPPRYISTVDSGNLAAYFIVAQQYLISIGAVELAKRYENLFDEMDFSFLLCKSSNLFYIGYHVDQARYDNSFYDLLASEARIASLVAIAKGNAEAEHWLSLGRRVTITKDGPGLLSWTGTSFEYLMPLIITGDVKGTLLSQACEVAVKAQQRFSKKRQIPWGISESAYGTVDFENNYQYRAFGLSELSLKRQSFDEVVISPYASLLGLLLAPNEVIQNARFLEREGLRGRYGFFEAKDYDKAHVIQSYFAHHQGMILATITNALCNELFVRLFTSAPLIAAVMPLLEEGVPALLKPYQKRMARQRTLQAELAEAKIEVIKLPLKNCGSGRALSNGHYTTYIDDAGSGFSSVARQFSLVASDELSRSGTYVYVKDREYGEVWSSAYAPTYKQPDQYECILSHHKVEFKREDNGIRVYTEIVVAADENMELRRVSLTNLSSKVRKLELTTYGEVVLNDRAAHKSHPAFSKMFVESEYLPELDALLFRRRPRTKEESEIFLLHMLSTDVVWGPTRYETSRYNFIGRGGSLVSPAALQAKLQNNVGCTMDPCFSLQQAVELQPAESHTVTLITIFASSRKEAVEAAEPYNNSSAINRAFDLAWSKSDIELRSNLVTPTQRELFQQLGAYLVGGGEQEKTDKKEITYQHLHRSSLWRLGISGDYPILLAEVQDSSRIKELALAHHFLFDRGIQFELVIIADFQEGYFTDKSSEALAIIGSLPGAANVDRRGGIFFRSRSQVGDGERALLHRISRLSISQSQSLEEALSEAREIFAEGYKLPSMIVTKAVLPSLCLQNNYGGLSQDLKSYQFLLSKSRPTPLPWSNVICPNEFGILVTENGGGFVWCNNARENRLVPWSNDAVSDPSYEYVLVEGRDGLWCTTPVLGELKAEYRVEHGAGYSLFENDRSLQKIYVHQRYPVKITELEFKESDSNTVHYVLEPLLAPHRGAAANYNIWQQGDAVYIQNSFNIDFPNQVMFIAANLPIVSACFDRAAILSRFGQLDLKSSGQYRGGRPFVRVAFKASGKVKLYLGVAETLQDAERIINSLKKEDSALRFGEVQNFWDSNAAVTIQSEHPEFDALINTFLPYQIRSARINGRTGFYQSSGAYGFRDQLQDVLALLYADPAIAKEHILLSASRQFIEGDVQHWWHPPIGRGVRTRISDDPIWLVYGVSRYLEVTGDLAILQQEVSYLGGEILKDGEHDRYFEPQRSGVTEPLLKHCLRAIDKVATFGPHGLPIIGGGDWNDGFNGIGKDGRGESVWLAWMLIYSLRKFLPYIPAADTGRYQSILTELLRIIDKECWDGEWYLRAFFDDGTPLGSRINNACKIDSITQSWAVLCGVTERSKQALKSATEQLVDKQYGIIKLLAPPFDGTDLSPGYIAGYPAGVRENGGQYTHAAAWLILAHVAAGNFDTAYELFNLINPFRITSTPEGVARYKCEPYVFCGDVYTTGRGGWSWYTGSAGWLYRLAVEGLLGVDIQNGKVSIAPKLPASFGPFKLTVRYLGQEFKYGS